MSIWEEVKKFPHEVLMREVVPLYGDHFPFEVRHYLADLVESLPWEDICECDVQHEDYAKQAYNSIVHGLQTEAEKTVDFVMKTKMTDFASKFKALYAGRPMDLVSVVKKCLTKEKSLLQSLQTPQNEPGSSSEQLQDITAALEEIQQMIMLSKDLLHQLQNRQVLEDYCIKCQKWLSISDSTEISVPDEKSLQLKQEKAVLEEQLAETGSYLCQVKLTMDKLFGSTVFNIQRLEIKINDELSRWKSMQQLAGNGFPFESQHLDTIQTWCESLASLILDNREQVIRMCNQWEPLPGHFLPGLDVSSLHGFSKSLIQCLTSLVQSTFIVEVQPSQILEKNRNFKSKVRLLVGKALNLYMNPTEVKATIISEIQARELIQKPLKACDLRNSGQILNSSGTMECQRALGQFSVSFTKMKLTKINRKRESSEKAPEEKFCILYQARFSIGQDLDFPVHTMSLPVVVTSHINQESDAMATILWDNQFSQVDRHPFIVPDVARWPDVAAMLRAKFTSETGRPLTDDNLQHLASRILGGDSKTDYSEAVVTWAQFNKNLLNPGVKCTFWTWLYSIIKLVRDKAVEGLWGEGLIMGFVSKEKARDLLMTKPSGTFLLRFSDSTLGGISLALIEDDAQTGRREVKSLEPFTKSDFTAVGLAEMIMGHTSFPLINLFPDIPKGSVFTKHLKEGKTTPDGYIRHKLVLDITGSGTGPSPLQNPTATMQQQLPEEDHQLIEFRDIEDLISWIDEPNQYLGETEYQ